MFMGLLLRADALRVFFGLRTIFSIDTIEIFDGDRIGLIGDNGAGKSTLLSVLHGDRPADEGTVRRFARSAIVRQFGAPEAAETVDASIRARLQAKDEVHEGISGGELERLRITQALSVQAPLLFVDEPTTNLDFDGVDQVRGILATHRGAMVLVSHDRALLDALCTSIWALEDGTLRVFPGNYSAYREQKARELDFQRFEYAQYRAEQARLRSAIIGVKDSARSVRQAPRRMGNSEARLHKRGSGTTAQGRLERTAGTLQSRLDSLEVKERPREDAQVRMMLEGRGGITSAVAVSASHLTLTAGEKTLLRDASFDLPTGKRTVLVGPNGSGKTTLLRAIQRGADGIRKSPGVILGWFGQETLDTLDPSLTLLENVLRDSVLPAHQARSLMAYMGLSAADMEKPAAVLSGGERAKAALARLMAGNATLLLLDEPGNHLDLHALEALEDMLSAYQGTLLLVSHDRRMIDHVAQRLLLLEDGRLQPYDGSLTEWEAHKAPRVQDTLSADIIRMRMAALLAQMGAPRQKKGYRREDAEAEYDQLVRQLQSIQGGKKP